MSGDEEQDMDYLLPKSPLQNLFSVPCAKGMEEILVKSILNKAKQKPEEMKIFSASTFKTQKNFIFVEAANNRDVYQSLKVFINYI